MKASEFTYHDATAGIVICSERVLELLSVGEYDKEAVVGGWFSM